MVDNNYQLLPASRTGFEFLGWYDNPLLSGEAVTQVNKSGNLYAKWQAIIKPEALFYQTGFEDVSKQAYASGDVESNGITWTLEIR